MIGVVVPYTYNTAADVREADKKSANFYFSANTMRAFRSRLSEKIYPVSDGAFFVISDKESHSDREYSVGYIDKEGYARKVDGSRGYRTSRQAHNRADFLASRNGQVECDSCGATINVWLLSWHNDEKHPSNI